MNKYEPHSTEHKHSYAQRQEQKPQPKKKQVNPFAVLMTYLIAVLILITIGLVIVSPGSTRAQNTLDDTLVPNYDIFSTETPTQPATPTPTPSLTPQPTIDFQSTQQSLNATIEEVAQQTQTGLDQELHQLAVMEAQAQKDQAEDEARLIQITVQLAIPQATDLARLTETQSALNYAATTTPRALEIQKEQNRIKQLDYFFTFVRLIIQGIILALAIILLIYVYKRFMVKQDQQLKREAHIEDYQAEQEAENRAVEFADQSKLLLGLVEASLDEYGSGSRKILGHAKVDWLTYKKWTGIINLLKNNNRVFYKEGGHGVKGYYLTRGNLANFFEEVSTGQFPPAGSYGRETE